MQRLIKEASAVQTIDDNIKLVQTLHGKWGRRWRNRTRPMFARGCSQISTLW